MIDSLTESYRDVLTAIGEDPNREGLLDTPSRAAKALEFLTSGYRQDLATLINGAVFESDNDEMLRP
jgi:GTP cyclohydrolase I